MTDAPNPIIQIRDAFAGLESVACALQDEIDRAFDQDELENVVITPEAATHIISEIRKAQLPLLAILEESRQRAANNAAQSRTGLILPPGCEMPNIRH